MLTKISGKSLLWPWPLSLAGRVHDRILTGSITNINKCMSQPSMNDSRRISLWSGSNPHRSWLANTVQRLYSNSKFIIKNGGSWQWLYSVRNSEVAVDKLKDRANQEEPPVDLMIAAMAKQVFWIINLFCLLAFFLHATPDSLELENWGTLHRCWRWDSIV